MRGHSQEAGSGTRFFGCRGKRLARWRRARKPQYTETRTTAQGVHRPESCEGARTVARFNECARFGLCSAS